MVTPRLGGGVERHLQDLCSYLADDLVCLVLQPLADNLVALRLSNRPTALSIAFTLPHGMRHLADLLDYLGVGSIHFHHAQDVPDQIWELPQLIGLPYDVTLHDYFFISGNPYQSDAEGRFCEDLSRQNQQDPSAMPLAEWQRTQSARLKSARRVIAPCRFTANLYRRHFPDLDIQVAYHADWERDEPYPPVGVPWSSVDHRLRVLVMGAINREKGADVLEAVARLSQDLGSPLEFLLLGYTYRSLSGPVQDLGTYVHENVPEHLAQIKPHLIWFPALVPETYGYALSEVLVCGLPVLASDLGAFGERLQGRPLTWIAPWRADAEGWHRELMRARQELLHQTGREKTVPWSPQPDPGRRFYRDEYLQAVGPPPQESSQSDLGWLHEAVASGVAGSYAISGKERLMLAYARARATRGGRTLIRLVPNWVRERVKRRL